MYKKILLKLSGESLMDDTENISREKTLQIAELIKQVQAMGISVGVVVGGGNFFRGRSHKDMQAINADSIGMLGTIMNALALRDALESVGVPCLISSPFDFHELIAVKNDEEITDAYNKGSVIIFGGGTGHINCSTDTAASMKAILIDADVIIKLTNVDGVYDKDPNRYSDAKKYTKLTHQKVLDNPEIKVMDLACIKDALDNNIDILVINFANQDNLINVLNGANIGTIITSK